MEHQVEFYESEVVLANYLQHKIIDIVLVDLEYAPLIGKPLLEQTIDKHPSIPLLGICRSESAALLVYGIPLLEKRLVSERCVNVFSKVLLKARGNEKLNEALKNIVGSSEQIVRLKKIVWKIAQRDSSVLITGESGTGKELVARAIAAYRSPFVAVNCSAIPETLFESELFGHRKGAFTGAVSDRKGAFEEARGGTLFLDEIGELPLTMQAKLLRVLQEGEVKPIGADRPLKTNVRIVTATNKDLQTEVKEARFREDLYYRLAVVPIHVPPLRDRKVDLKSLVEHLLTKYNPNPYLQLKIEKSSEQRMENYAFPGNIRELENMIERGVSSVNPKEAIHIDLPKSQEEKQEVEDWESWGLVEIEASIKNRERKFYQFKLSQYSFSVQKLADALGLQRNALQNRLMRLNVSAREEKQRFIKLK